MQMLIDLFPGILLLVMVGLALVVWRLLAEDRHDELPEPIELPTAEPGEPRMKASSSTRSFRVDR